MRRVGILGGSFDPPHIAHLAIAEEALRKIPLDEVLFMPAPSPPHKSNEELTPYPLRSAMVRLAVEGHPGLKLSLMEEFRNGPSFTVDLLRHFRERREEDPYFIIGADTLQDLPNWKDPESIVELATLVVFPRKGYPQKLPIDGDASVVLFTRPAIDISSSAIREMIHAGRSARKFLPEAVHKFVLDKLLYT